MEGQERKCVLALQKQHYPTVVDLIVQLVRSILSKSTYISASLHDHYHLMGPMYQTASFQSLDGGCKSETHTFSTSTTKP